MFTFTNQVEENVGKFLSYPFHVDNTKLTNIQPIAFPDARNARTFEDVLQHAYKEPFAVYLTEDDKSAYSAQELELLNAVITFEQERVNQGMCKIDINIDDETMDALLDYKTEHRLTFEQAVIELLTKMINQLSTESEEV